MEAMSDQERYQNGNLPHDIETPLAVAALQMLIEPVEEGAA